MLKKYLEEISKVEIELIETKLIDWKIINLVLFWEKIPKDLVKHKQNLYSNLDKQNTTLSRILTNISNKTKNIWLQSSEILTLEKEIFIKQKKIEFVKKIYDIEASKIDSNYKIIEELENYDYYNKIFYWFSKENLKSEVIISKNKDVDISISKEKLLELLEFSKKIVPELKWNFWSFAGLSHDDWILNIPEEQEYNIKRIIAIFFHEMTHFFRYLNWKNNLWFDYKFTDYDDLEEGITGYNEYKYWNKIIDYWKYNAYYDKCYQVLLENISQSKKKERIFQILKNKWFSREKTDLLYTRFYRYSKIWGDKLFLKELIYSNAYKNVTKLLTEDENNYEKIMSGKIGLFELEECLIDSKKNIDSKVYFDIMVEKIKLLIVNH